MTAGIPSGYNAFMARDLKALQKKLQTFALSFPDTRVDHPWGETVAKVGKKVFVFNLGVVPPKDSKYPPGLSVKLRPSLPAISKRSFAEPTGYGLARSGWVTIRFDRAESPTFEELQGWIRESYCLVAPKKLAKQVMGDAAGPVKKPARSAERPARRATRPARKRAGGRG